MHRAVVWWLFDHMPEWFQDWAESWARTLIVRRSPTYKAGLEWARSGDAGETVTAEEFVKTLNVKPSGPGPHVIQIARNRPNVHSTDEYPIREDLQRIIAQQALAALRHRYGCPCGKEGETE